MLERILKQVRDQNVRLTQHALQEMAEEDCTLDEIVEAIASGQILEDYPRHRRGACCLVNGMTATGGPGLRSSSLRSMNLSCPNG